MEEEYEFYIIKSKWQSRMEDDFSLISCLGFDWAWVSNCIKYLQEDVSPIIVLSILNKIISHKLWSPKKREYISINMFLVYVSNVFFTLNLHKFCCLSFSLCNLCYSNFYPWKLFCIFFILPCKKRWIIGRQDIMRNKGYEFLRNRRWYINNWERK